MIIHHWRTNRQDDNINDDNWRLGNYTECFVNDRDVRLNKRSERLYGDREEEDIDEYFSEKQRLNMPDEEMKKILELIKSSCKE